MLSANLEATLHTLPEWQNLSRSVLVEIAGVKVGLIGALTEETPSIVLAAFFAGLGVKPLAAAVTDEARKLRLAGARLVVLVAHAGGVCRSFDDPRDLTKCQGNAEIVRAVRLIPAGLVDVVMGGHTHHAMAHFVEQVAVTNAWARGRAFSRVDVTVPADPSAPLDVRIFPPRELCQQGSDPCSAGDYEGKAIRASPAIQRAIQPWLERATEVKARPLKTRVLRELEPEHDRESALGNLMADLVRAVAKGSDVAIVNGGGLRASLPAGDLTYGGLYRVIPFDNRLALVRITAGDLALRLREHFARAAHGIVSVSGIRVAARCEAGALVVDLLRSDGRQIRSDEELLLATSDFLAGGGDDLLPAKLLAGRVEIAGPPNLRDRIAEHLGKAGKPLGEKLLDPKRPRLTLPAPRPVACGGS
jgi:5'-nucleotidase